MSGERLHDLRVPHKGDVVSEVIEAAHAVAAGFRAVDEVRQAMQGCRLEDERQLAFAQAALAMRYGPLATRSPITPAQLLAARRADDQGEDLWRVLNRVQENLTRGGLAGRSTRGRRITTRAVNAIGANLQLNRALWTLAREQVASV